MHEFICLQCGMKATSKCVQQRSVFIRNEMDGLLSHVMKFELTRSKPDPECPTFPVPVELTITLKERAAPGKSDYQVTLEIWQDLADRLYRMTNSSEDRLGYPTLLEWACSHDELAILDERCLLGCCTRKSWFDLADRCVELGNYRLAAQFCVEAMGDNPSAEQKLQEVCDAAGFDVREFLIDPTWQKEMARQLNRLPMSTRAKRALLRNLGVNGEGQAYRFPSFAFLVKGRTQPFREWAAAAVRNEVDLTSLLGQFRVGPKTLDELREALVLYDAQQYERQALRFDPV